MDKKIMIIFSLFFLLLYMSVIYATVIDSDTTGSYIYIQGGSIIDYDTFGSTIVIWGGGVVNGDTFGSTITIGSTGNGTTNNSEWWEFYKIDYNRGNVYNPGVNLVDINDCYSTFVHFYPASFNYYYDVYSDDVIDIVDCYSIFTEFT